VKKFDQTVPKVIGRADASSADLARMAQRVGAAFTAAPTISSFVRGAAWSSALAAPLPCRPLSISSLSLSSPTTIKSVKTCRHNVRMVAADEAVVQDVQQAMKTKNKPKDGQPRARREKKSSQSRILASALEKYEPVIGVEVHVQLATKTKAYCPCSTKAVRTPNTNICPICMGHPGALPVLNRKVVQLAAQASMALNCDVSPYSRFDRKNYYYADTSKNYQITQQHHPIAEGGYLVLATSGKRIGITRLHMEEDSAKMSHEGTKESAGRLSDSTYSLIDFNRGGIPLAEIVSEPDMRSGVEAAEYGQELQRILRYIRASDCNMQDGSLRCDVNVSIRPKGQSKLGTKVELKNLNSFAAVQKSIDFEIERQAALLDDSSVVIQETRTWDENDNSTKSMRVKEGAADYRYFPEPDLPPLMLEESQLKDWRDALPELPAEKRSRFASEYGLSTYDAFLLADDVSVAAYFENAINMGADPKTCANWIMGDVTKVLKFEKMDITECKLTAVHLAELIKLIDDGTINGKIAKDLIPELVAQGGSPSEIVQARYVVLSSDAASQMSLLSMPCKQELAVTLICRLSSSL
jgi:aspartyl-tRNA(Asn)/glutamyl-tRNA(Gln) amidotransferase subunit B